MLTVTSPAVRNSLNAIKRIHIKLNRNISKKDLTILRHGCVHGPSLSILHAETNGRRQQARDESRRNDPSTIREGRAEASRVIQKSEWQRARRDIWCICGKTDYVQGRDRGDVFDVNASINFFELEWIFRYYRAFRYFYFCSAQSVFSTQNLFAQIFIGIFELYFKIT